MLRPAPAEPQRRMTSIFGPDLTATACMLCCADGMWTIPWLNSRSIVLPHERHTHHRWKVCTTAKAALCPAASAQIPLLSLGKRGQQKQCPCMTFVNVWAKQSSMITNPVDRSCSSTLTLRRMHPWEASALSEQVCVATSGHVPID